MESVRVERSALQETVRLDGVIEAVQQSTVSAQTSGTVVRLPFDVDDSVPAGALIVQLEDSEQQSRVAQAQAALDEAQSGLQDARQQFARIEAVHERGLVSRQEYDQAKNSLDAAGARVERAEAALSQARQQLDYTRIEAPYGGIEGLVDIDTTVETPTRQWEVHVDRDRAARLGVSQAQVVQALQTVPGGSTVSYLHDEHAKYPVPIRVVLSEGDKAQKTVLMSLSVRSRSGELVPLASIAEVREADWLGARYHKDLLPVTYVTADMAGDVDSPLYGMFRMVSQLNEQSDAPEQYFIRQPDLPEQGTLKWDGEWQITYETFRDMGAAYSVGIFMIFVLLVAQFRSYLLPLVIMAPIPLTLIGIMPGHALLGREFTATSMIGMIALAGIIVRNSILLVVFIRQLLDEGVALDEAVVLAGAVRIKPIALTAISAMLGAYFILNDPIFNGLAVSLVFGLAMSTLFTIIVVPCCTTPWQPVGLK
jgi:RND family efflux transporter MFP subunit